jgi:Lon protease-like protein
MIGMVLLKEGWEEGYQGNPPIHNIGAVGEIVRSKSFDNGTYTLILQGLAKFMIQEESFDKPYRQGRVGVIHEPLFEPLPPFVKEKLIALLTRYPEKGEEILQAALETKLDDDAFIATLSSNLPLTCLEKQFLLEAEGLQQRSRRLLELIQLGVQETSQKGD